MANFTDLMKNIADNSKKSASSSSSSFDVVLADLSAPINGKFGQFRTFKVNDQSLLVDERKVTGASFFTPSCKATISLSEYKDKDGKERVAVATLVILPPVASGFFISK